MVDGSSSASSMDAARSARGIVPRSVPGSEVSRACQAPVPGFTRRVFAAVMEHCFADPSVRRVVVEPDVRNERIRVLNEEAGFVVAMIVDLPGKQAALSFCTRDDWEARR